MGYLFHQLHRNTKIRNLDIYTGKPCISPEYPEKNRSYLCRVVERKNIKHFKKANFDADIDSGIEYGGKDLAVCRKYCNVSLEFNPTRFKEALREEIFTNTFEVIAREILETAVALSEAIQRRVDGL